MKVTTPTGTTRPGRRHAAAVGSRDPSDSSRLISAGSGFGGQFSVAIPSTDMVVVINQWNILPGQPSLRALSTVGRLLRATRRDDR